MSWVFCWKLLAIAIWEGQIVSEEKDKDEVDFDIDPKEL